MIKYIKFFGTNGTGKTTTVREISKVLSGHICDNWKNIDKPPIISYNQCDCGKYVAIGRWKTDAKVNGMDTMRGEKYKTFQASKNKLTFNYRQKVEEGELDFIQAEVIFEEGLVTASPGIQHALNKKFELYSFHLDYPIEFCIENYKKRGSLIQDDITIEKMKGKLKASEKTFEKLEFNNKYKLSGTLEENVSKVLEITGIKPCNCMKDKIICEEVQQGNVHKRKSLFD